MASPGVFSVRHLTLVFVCLVFASPLSAQNTEEGAPTCVCVWFYLCRNGTLIRNGEGLIEPRSSFRRLRCDKQGYICCPFEDVMENMTGSSLPDGLTELTTPPIEENETEPDEPDQAASFPTFNRPGSNEPVPNGPVPNEPVPNGPVPNGPVPNGPVPNESIPNVPVPNGQVPNGPILTGLGDGITVNPNVQIEDKPQPVANPIFVPKPGCGVKRVQLQQRISFTTLDESLAYYAEFPWMLAVLTEDNPMAYRFHCGASLIHKQVALTAAHCIDRFPVTSLRIRAGEWNVKSTNEPQPHQDRRVSRVELHPFYRHSDLRHDIALIFLDSPFNVTDNVDTICLPEPNSLFHGSTCSVTGWGKDTKGPMGMYHKILHKVDVPVVPCVECENRLRCTKLGPYFKLHHSFMCAGGEPDKDACKGDGGGPLVCPTEEENRWVQAGIVSWGIGCGTTTPGVYTDVSLHSGWINRRLHDFENIPINPHEFPSSPNQFPHPPNQFPHPPNQFPHPPNQFPYHPNHFPNFPYFYPHPH